jgi:hypothetical protein
LNRSRKFKHAILETRPQMVAGAYVSRCVTGTADHVNFAGNRREQPGV